MKKVIELPLAPKERDLFTYRYRRNYPTLTLILTRIQILLLQIKRMKQEQELSDSKLVPSLPYRRKPQVKGIEKKAVTLAMLKKHVFIAWGERTLKERLLETRMLFLYPYSVQSPFFRNEMH